MATTGEFGRIKHKYWLSFCVVGYRRLKQDGALAIEKVHWLYKDGMSWCHIANVGCHAVYRNSEQRNPPGIICAGRSRLVCVGRSTAYIGERGEKLSWKTVIHTGEILQLQVEYTGDIQVLHQLLHSSIPHLGILPPTRHPLLARVSTLERHAPDPRR